jgi:hypothetical protein
MLTIHFFSQWHVLYHTITHQARDDAATQGSADYWWAPSPSSAVWRAAWPYVFNMSFVGKLPCLAVCGLVLLEDCIGSPAWCCFETSMRATKVCCCIETSIRVNKAWCWLETSMHVLQ